MRRLGFLLWIVSLGAASAVAGDSHGVKDVDAEGILRQLGGDQVLVVPATGRFRIFTLEDFIAVYGDPGNSEMYLRDPGEDIIPTPGEPPPDPDWSPGDTVHYWRDAIHGNSYYTRLTVYRYTGSNTWYRMSNTLSLPGTIPPNCSQTPCAPIFEENEK